MNDNATAYNTLLQLTCLTLDHLRSSKCLPRLHQLLNSCQVVNKHGAAAPDSKKNQKIQKIQKNLLDDICRHQFLINFESWDRSLNESLKSSRRSIGFNDEMVRN